MASKTASGKSGGKTGHGGSGGGGNGGGADDVIVIKKYANRRLYDTRKSSYITLDDLAAMVREGREFCVVDAKSDEDITHNVLTQIIMEEEQRGQTMLPVSFLRELITLYGDSMQAMVPGYLEASMGSFRRNQQQFRSALEGALAGNPLAEIAKRNMAMFEAATSAFRPTPAEPVSPEPAPAEPAPPETAAATHGAADQDAEIAALRAEIAALKASGAQQK
ncbi:MAG: polyhydroxyalkanoate synthesis repressor PhaR [Sphingopyxis sp.]